MDDPWLNEHLKHVTNRLVEDSDKESEYSTVSGENTFLRRKIAVLEGSQQAQMTSAFDNLNRLKTALDISRKQSRERRDKLKEVSDKLARKTEQCRSVAQLSEEVANENDALKDMVADLQAQNSSLHSQIETSKATDAMMVDLESQLEGAKKLLVAVTAERDTLIEDLDKSEARRAEEEKKRKELVKSQAIQLEMWSADISKISEQVLVLLQNHRRSRSLQEIMNRSQYKKEKGRRLESTVELSEQLCKQLKAAAEEVLSGGGPAAETDANTLRGSNTGDHREGNSKKDKNASPAPKRKDDNNASGVDSSPAHSPEDATRSLTFGPTVAHPMDDAFSVLAPSVVTARDPIEEYVPEVLMAAKEGSLALVDDPARRRKGTRKVMIDSQHSLLKALRESSFEVVAPTHCKVLTPAQTVAYVEMLLGNVS